MKYRIVSRNKSPFNGSTLGHPYYYAQFEVFGVWIDCRYNPLVDDTYDCYDTKLSVVERWVNSQIGERLPVEEEVVKTYD